MRLRLIREFNNGKDHWLVELDPDSLLRGRDAHSFAYLDGTLWVDPRSGRSHAQWGDADPEFEATYDRAVRSITGRYGVLEGQLVVALWSYPPGTPGHNLDLLRPCLRQLARYVPPHAMVVGHDGTVPPTPLSDLVGARTAAPRRGHRHWQLRQTSEAREY